MACSSSTNYRRINAVRVVGRGYDNDTSSLLNRGQLLQQQVHDLRPIFDVVPTKLRAIRDSVHLIDEQDAGSLTACP